MQDRPKTDPAANEARQAARSEKRERAKDARLIAQMANDLRIAKPSWITDDCVNAASLTLRLAKDATRKD
jgi:hypothetical protein